MDFYQLYTLTLHRTPAKSHTASISCYFLCVVCCSFVAVNVEGAAIRHDCPSRTYYDEGTEMLRSCHVICDEDEGINLTSLECELKCEEFFKCINGLLGVSGSTRKTPTSTSYRRVDRSKAKTRTDSVAHEKKSTKSVATDGLLNEKVSTSSCTDCKIYRITSLILYGLASMATVMMTVLVCLLRKERKTSATNLEKSRRSINYTVATATKPPVPVSDSNDDQSTTYTSMHISSNESVLPD